MSFGVWVGSEGRTGSLKRRMFVSSARDCAPASPRPEYRVRLRGKGGLGFGIGVRVRVRVRVRVGV